MDNQRNKINFYFDKNIWSDIIEMSESDRVHLQNLINPLKEQLKIGIYYSPVGVLELIKGMKIEKHYQKCQYEIRIADRITNKHILEDPWNHVIRTARTFLRVPDSKFDLRFLNLCRDIAIVPYHQMERRIQTLRETLIKWEKEWLDGITSIKAFFREKFSIEDKNQPLAPLAQEYRKGESVLIRKETAWIAFCDRYILPSELKRFPWQSAYEKFHSFRYWVSYRLAYENKLFYQNKNPECSDYLDWQQVVYLNIMDYLVTNDHKFRAILKESDNTEIHTVAITFNEFLDLLQGKLPLKRAPDTTSEKWYDAHPI